MKTIKNPILYFAVALLAGIIFYGCKKDNDGPYGVPVHTGNSITTTISGIVLDESNASLEGVTVNAYGQTTTTNQYGVFVLQNVSVAKSRCIVNYSKAGYFNRADAFIPTANTVNYVRIVMISDAQTHTVNTSTGGTVTLPDGSSVQFPASGFVVAATGAPYNGVVTITFKHLMPGTPNFGFSIPGGDLSAINSSGEDVILYTFGMIGVELSGSGGEALQLAYGKTATITMPVAPMQMAEAKPTIPLWYFNESTALWMEEGSATLVGNNYVGTVTHFSWWNYDYQGPRATLKGKVVDCNGTPMPNINVTIDGWYNTTTNSLGEYQDDVPANMVFTVQVLASFNSGVILNSQLENTPVLSNGQTYIVPTLIVPCGATITGTVKNCSGQPINGFINISQAGYTAFQYAINGAFNFKVIENSPVQINAYIANYLSSVTVTSPFAPNVLNVGDILLCDTIAVNTDSIPPNSFVLVGGTFNRIFEPINPLAVNDSSSTSFHVTVQGNTIDLYSISATFLLTDTLLGFYGWQDYSGFNIFISKTNPQQSFQVIPKHGDGGINLLKVENIGGRVQGTYEGTAIIYINGTLSDTTFISGNFDVLRTY